MKFILKNRPDRIGTEILSILFQFYYCYINNYSVCYNNSTRFKDSIFMKTLFKVIDDYNLSLKNNENNCSTAVDLINIAGPGETDMCYGMGFIVQLIQNDMLSFFKKNFYCNIKDFYNIQGLCYSIPFDVDNSIVIHLRLDDMFFESDYDGKICSNHYINLINNSKPCHFIYSSYDNKWNQQSPLSSDKIKSQLDKLLEQFPSSKIIIITSPNTSIPTMNFKYDMLIQNNHYNYDLFLLSKSKKIILSRSNFALISLFFGEHTHVHMPLWGHFACAGFGTKYDNCKFTYFY
jgi:hypothetical protein